MSRRGRKKRGRLQKGVSMALVAVVDRRRRRPPPSLLFLFHSLFNIFTSQTAPSNPCLSRLRIAKAHLIDRPDLAVARMARQGVVVGGH